MNNFPIRFQFEHEGIIYIADLVEGNASATGECCICRQPLRGRPYYATNPPLLCLHADCAQQLLRQQQQQRSGGTSRSLSFPSPYPQQQYMTGSYPLYHPPPWSWHPNQYWNNGGYHYNNVNPEQGAITTIALGAFLQALFGSMLNG